ncbi:MAG: ABC transporter ATP-binding protein [Cryobacterium sp.]|nr:ABC transporter ATP-binding protein [Cryobacterium sp.]
MPTTSTLTRTSAPALPVSLDRVSRTFRDTANEPKPVLRDVSLEISPGEIVSLIGASGCGKSTLLRQIAGLDRPTGGQVRIDGTAIDGIDQRVAVAFQEPRLLPWRSLRQNVSLGLPKGTARVEGQARVGALLDLVHLGEAAALRPRQVSGGMAQRASLARALSRGPGVLVLDEPFGALDALTRLKMQDLLIEIHSAEPATIILVTHDVDEALYLSDRVVLLGVDADAPSAGAGIRSITSVPGSRPRDRGDARLAELRVELLDGLGVPSHHQPQPH